MVGSCRLTVVHRLVGCWFDATVSRGAGANAGVSVSGRASYASEPVPCEAQRQAPRMLPAWTTTAHCLPPEDRSRARTHAQHAIRHCRCLFDWSADGGGGGGGSRFGPGTAPTIAAILDGDGERDGGGLRSKAVFLILVSSHMWLNYSFNFSLLISINILSIIIIIIRLRQLVQFIIVINRIRSSIDVMQLMINLWNNTYIYSNTIIETQSLNIKIVVVLNSFKSFSLLFFDIKYFDRFHIIYRTINDLGIYWFLYKAITIR